MIPDGFFDSLSVFHFIRPWWLLFLLPVGMLWWLVRGAAGRSASIPSSIAPHLARALQVGSQSKQSIRPVDSAVLVLSLLVLAAAGPTWSRIPNPLVSDTAPLVVALKVTKSMMQVDIAPSRLERSKQKVLDLLTERSGAKTALVAYAGTAHQVAPLTEDPAVLKPFLEGLDPSIMPKNGTSLQAALKLAQDILSSQDVPGAILFMADEIADADTAVLSQHAQGANSPVLFWFASRDQESKSKLSALSGYQVVEMTPDSKDVVQVSRNINAVYEAALANDERQKWRDQGRFLAFPAVLIMLFWFRRGWTMQWAVVLLSAGVFLQSSEVRADGWKDWFFTPDQLGRMAFEDKQYEKAADLFHDPMWKAFSLYRLGKYEDAAELYSWQESADAAMGEGMSLLRSRAYRPAIAAFEKAVARDPNNKAAQHNLELARYMLEYVETTREQSDTGESGIGADDVAFDNEAGRGTQTQQPTGEALPETAEQWMRTVDTRTGDFLKTRFALEAARGAQ
ncbi:VWA domain-containing protein [uncultured Roseibium sp.]|uniref:VWA domain-containing protein n=1 Tax=uncultured Roseibium sp. TaxID=1936171 RepID=UPI00260E9101|nr:VWA domain-containing protein [uncultured Roseibium sp.]